jgi:hypothetical protein
MCLTRFSNEELIREIASRGILTNSRGNNLIISGLSLSDVSVILTKGLPQKKMKCRECGEMKDPLKYAFYKSRVDADGYLMRSNALCDECAVKSNKQRKEVLDNAVIPEKPNKGDICKNCERSWDGNWHRHHIGEKFVSYICGHCNMSFSDQRNKKNNNNL